MSYMFFENKDCEFYPCHKIDKLNCLLCFCPLYGMNCKGNFEMIQGKNGQKVKDCSKCLIPHMDTGYDYVIKMLETANNEKKER